MSLCCSGVFVLQTRTYVTQVLDRLETQTAVELSQDPKRSKLRTMGSSSAVIGRRWAW